MTELQTAQKTIERIILSARQAERRARNNKSFASQAIRVGTFLKELTLLDPLSMDERARLAAQLETQSESMRLAMVLGGLIRNAAKKLRIDPKAAPEIRPARPPIRAPAPAP